MEKAPPDAPAVLSYLDEQVEALRSHLSGVFESFAEKSVHQSRVATRRLKAGLALFSPFVESKRIESFAKFGKQLRRRLGRLRDADVMIGHLQSMPKNERTTAAVEWSVARFRESQTAGRETFLKKLQPADALARLGSWWGVRAEFEAVALAAADALRHAVHDRLDAFARDANTLANGADHSLDVHQLRIEGKELRYSLEIAQKLGHAVPASTMKHFKSMQDQLGLWHDFAAIAQTINAFAAERALALHDSITFRGVATLMANCSKKAETSLRGFVRTWKKHGDTVQKSIHAAIPLTRSQTDRDRLEILKSEPQAIASGAVPPVE